MKHSKIAALMLVLAVAAACQEKEPDYTDNGSYTDGDFKSFTADFASLAATKADAAYNDEAKTLVLSWKEGDNVGVYSTHSPVLFKASSAGTSTTLTTSIKMTSAESYSAVYPYLTDALMENGKLKLVVPSEQTAVKDNPIYHRAVARTSASSFSFKNVTAMVRLHLIAENVKSVILSGNAGEIIGGDINVNTGDASYTIAGDGVPAITLKPAVGASVIEAGVYYVSILPQDLSKGFTVTYEVGQNTVEQKSEQAMQLDGNSLIICDSFGTAVEGTQSNPFTVGSVTDLQGLSAKLALDVPNYVIMTGDIDMSGVTEWIPICNDRTKANIPELHFDGKGHSIKNFAPTTIAAGTGGDQASLFGILYGSCRNLNLTDATINQPEMSTTAVVCGFAGYEDRGSLTTMFENVHVSGTVVGKKVVAGFAAGTNKASYKNCSADVDVTASDNHVGGFAARGNGTGDNIFENCSASGDVTCSKKNGRFIGGFYGGDDAYTGQKMTFSKCFATGTVTGGYQIAALVGYFDAGTYKVSNCYATGPVRHISGGTQGKQFGGLVGVNKGNLTIEQCYYTGSLDSGKAESVGGILGLGAGGDATISRCFSMADLTSPTYGVGGITGYTKGASLTVEDCFASGTLTASEKVGAIVGLVETTTTVKNCKHNTNLDVAIGSGTATEQGNAKLTAAETADYSTPSKIAAKLGWNSDIWDLSGNAPVLK